MITIWFLAENCLILEMFLYYQSCRTLHSVFNQIEYFIVLITSIEKESNRFFHNLTNAHFTRFANSDFSQLCKFVYFDPSTNFCRIWSNLSVVAWPQQWTHFINYLMFPPTYFPTMSPLFSLSLFVQSVNWSTRLKLLAKKSHWKYLLFVHFALNWMTS